jgi:hypothetical protein
MAGADRSRLQGTQYTGVSLIFQVTTAGGNQLPWLEGVMGSTYEEKRTRPIVWGSRRDGRPIGKGAGRYEPGTLTLDTEEATWDFVTDALANEAADGESFGDVSFTVQIQLYEEDKPQTTITKTYDFCNVDGEKGDYPTTADPLKIALAFSYLSKDTDGKTLYSQTRTP